MEPDGIVALALAVGVPVWLAIEEIIHRSRAVRERARAAKAARRDTAVVVQPGTA